MKRITALTAIALAMCNTGSAQTAGDGLKDLDSMTFACPRAALNAAARAAAKVPSQGTYQFAYFNIVTGSHHARYEVRFNSNYAGEQDLTYCVALYCQQGWEPAQGGVAVTPGSCSASASHRTGALRPSAHRQGQ